MSEYRDEMTTHLASASAARQTGDGKAAAHHCRNAGAVLAQAEQAAVDAKPEPVMCGECGRQERFSRPASDKAAHRAMRTVFREARGTLGVDAVAASSEAVDNEGRMIGYGTTVRDVNPNG